MACELSHHLNYAIHMEEVKETGGAQMSIADVMIFGSFDSFTDVLYIINIITNHFSNVQI